MKVEVDTLNLLLELKYSFIKKESSTIYSKSVIFDKKASTTVINMILQLQVNIFTIQ